MKQPNSLDRVRNKKNINMEIDPPPDLVIEVDLTSDSLNKFPLYSPLGVPEVWRYEDILEIWLLEQGQYVRHPSSTAVPILTDEVVSELLEAKRNLKRPAWLRHGRKQIRS